MNRPESSDHLEGSLLQEYVDGVLAPEAVSQIGEHLVGCSYCQGRVEKYQQLFLTLQSLPDEKWELALAPLIVDRITARQRFNLSSTLKWAAIILPLLLFIWLMWPTIQATAAQLQTVVLELDPLDWIAGVSSEAAEQLTRSIDEVRALFTVRIERLPTVLDRFLPTQDAWFLLGGIGLIWLFGNRLLIQGYRRGQNGHV